METYSVNSKEEQIIVKIYEQIVNHIDQLEENEIKILLESDKSQDKNFNAYKIRIKIFEKMLSIIDSKGRCRLPQQTVLKIVELLADKVRLSLFTK